MSEEKFVQFHLDKETYRRLKVLLAHNGQTLQDFLEEMVAKALMEEGKK